MKNTLIAPSACCRFGNLQRDIEMINKVKPIGFIDIMDGVFVPNISYGMPVLKPLTAMQKQLTFT
jgi:ribulose-phosphate 3-epimerase